MIHKAASPVTSMDPILNIGEVLRRMGACTQDDIDEAVSVMRSVDMKLGEALVHLGACTQLEVDAALDRQRRLAGGAGDVLQALGEILRDGSATLKRIADSACSEERAPA